MKPYQPWKGYRWLILPVCLLPFVLAVVVLLRLLDVIA